MCALRETVEVNSVLKDYFIPQLLKGEFDSAAECYFTTSHY